MGSAGGVLACSKLAGHVAWAWSPVSENSRPRFMVVRGIRKLRTASAGPDIMQTE